MNVAQPSNDIGLFTEIGRLIAADDAPPWLAQHLRSWVGSLFLDRYVQKIQPTKAQMRKTLKRVEDAASLLTGELASVPVREFLELPPFGPFADLRALDHDLSDLASRAGSAANSERLSTAANVTRSGRGKASPTGAISPKGYCALLVAETWKYFHKQYPSLEVHGPPKPR
jgi:hypothetical protein